MVKTQKKKVKRTSVEKVKRTSVELNLNRKNEIEVMRNNVVALFSAINIGTQYIVVIYLRRHRLDRL
jgi:hypothetical protein